MLPSLTAAFLLGLAVGSYTPYLPIVLSGFLAGAAVALTVWERAGRLDRRQAVLWYAILLSGIVYWVLTVPVPSRHDVPTSRELVPKDVSARIISQVQHAPGRQTFIIETEEVPVRKIRLTWREPGSVPLHGDRIQFRGRFRPPSGSLNLAGFDYAAYLERQGIEAVTTATGPEGIRLIESGSQDPRWAVWNQIDRWRSMIREAAIRTLHQPALGIFLGIVIGERGYLQQDLQEWFMATGTIHLLSISGSHLGLVAVVMFWLVKRAVLRLPPSMLLAVSRVFIPSRVAILITWPIVCMYALLAGAELATMRSLVMISLAMVALWLGHARYAHQALAVAALAIVLHDPQAVFDISFQLSFLSVLMMVQCGLWIVRWEESVAKDNVTPVNSVARYGRDALFISGGVTLATLPLVALYFYQVPWLGIVTNLLAIPFTGLVLVPVGLLAALGTLMTGSSELWLGSLEESLLTWLVQGLHWCAVIPFAEWHVAAPSIPGMMVFYAALWMASTTSDLGRRRILPAVVIAFVVCWWMWSPRLGLDGDRWRVTFLDVGQGDSAVIELPEGQTVLIDGGARYERFDMGRGVVGPFLWNRGIRHIDHVVGTHQQLDHVGGLIWVLGHLSVGRYWGTGVERPEQFVTDLKTVLQQQHIPEHLAVKGQELLASGACRLAVLNPSSPELGHPVLFPRGGTSLNNQSIVTRLQCGAESILFSADVEKEGLRHLTGTGRQPVTVIKVPHHGARSSLDQDWLRDIQPQYAVISVGRGNSYGHPVPEVLEAYAREHVTVSRTDLDGAIWMTGRLSSPGIVVTSMRDLLLSPVDLHTDPWHKERENWTRLWLRLFYLDALPGLHA